MVARTIRAFLPLDLRIVFDAWTPARQPNRPSSPSSDTESGSPTDDDDDDASANESDISELASSPHKASSHCLPKTDMANASSNRTSIAFPALTDRAEEHLVRQSGPIGGDDVVISDSESERRMLSPSSQARPGAQSTLTGLSSSDNFLLASIKKRRRVSSGTPPSIPIRAARTWPSTTANCPITPTKRPSRNISDHNLNCTSKSAILSESHRSRHSRRQLSSAQLRKKQQMKEKQRRISDQLYRAKPDLAADSQYAKRVATRREAPAVQHNATSRSMALSEGTDANPVIDAATIGFRYRDSQDDSVPLVSHPT